MQEPSALMRQNPNFDFLYLNDMLGEDHPMYAFLREKYKNSTQGKRLEAFKKENDKYMDALHTFGHTRLDNIVRKEGVNYTGDPADRIGKIRTIRTHRDQIEDSMLKHMTTDERKAYLAEAEALREEERKKAAARPGETDDSIKKRDAVKAAKRSAFEEMVFRQERARTLARAKGHAFLDAELARRKEAVDPVTARKRAIDERQKTEEELARTQEEVDDAAKKALEAPQKGAEDHEGGDSPAAPNASQTAPAPAPKDRAAALAKMNKTELDAQMKKHELTITIGMTNLQKIDAIMTKEYPSA